MELWKTVYPGEIADAMIEKSKDMDFLDYEESVEEEKEALENALYQLKAICENQYNNDYYRTFFNALVKSLGIDY